MFIVQVISEMYGLQIHCILCEENSMNVNDFSWKRLFSA